MALLLVTTVNVVRAILKVDEARPWNDYPGITSYKLGETLAVLREAIADTFVEDGEVTVELDLPYAESITVLDRDLESIEGQLSYVLKGREPMNRLMAEVVLEFIPFPEDHDWDVSRQKSSLIQNVIDMLQSIRERRPVLLSDFFKDMSSQDREVHTVKTVSFINLVIEAVVTARNDLANLKE